MTKTSVQYYLEEGEKRGEKRGALQARREDVLRLLQLRFHVIPSPLLKKVKAIRRMDRLNALFDKAAIARGIDEIELD